MSTTARGSWTAQEGTPSPLGVTWIESEQGYNFALYSKHAERFTLLLYRDDDVANPVPAQSLSHQRNPYNQNNETSWLDWDRLEASRDVLRFFKRPIAFRKAHRSLGRSRFWRDDVRWYVIGPEGA